MKKFKNKLAVTGSISLLKAFKEELVELGYNIKDSMFDHYTKYNYNLVTNWNDEDNKMSYCTNGHSRIKANQQFILPQDWNKALQLAAEVEEEIPEYVEWVNNIGCGGLGWMCDKSDFKKGKIFCTLTDDLPKSGLNTDKSNWRYALSKEWYAVNFKPSTKEAFDEQNKPKFKQGDWLYSEKENSLIKFKSVDSKNKIASDEYHQIVNDYIFTGSSDYVTDSYKVSLATKEQIEKILTKVAESKYKKGDKVDQKVAYHGLGDIYKLYSNKTLVQHDSINNGFNISVDGKGVYNSDDGIWAEIVSENVIINGYTIEKHDDVSVKVGCKVFTVSELKKLHYFLFTYDGVYSIDGKDWYHDDVIKVIDAFNEM